uniref:Uncharacterized protein n=1 Tax=Octopus bimaculoides TaxID=37653 RepID=A0A0L8I036_OCTBM
MLFIIVLALCLCLTGTQHYKIIQSENVVLNKSTTLRIVVPNMRRPVAWSCGNYRYECDTTCINSPDFKVTQSENSSTVWIRKVTKDSLSWTFYDLNFNSGKIDLNINGLRKSETYEISQNEYGVLSVSGYLRIEIPNMKRPVIWRYQNYKYECDLTCANSTEYRVTQSRNVSTFWIRNVTNERLDWTFCDDNLNYGKFDLKMHSLTKAETYITQNVPVMLGGNVTIRVEASLIETPISWTNGRNNLQCMIICDKNNKYEITHFGNVSILSIRNVTEEDFTWRFCDFYFCSENYTLLRKDMETKNNFGANGSEIRIFAIAISSIFVFGVILLTIFFTISKYSSRNICKRYKSLILQGSIS